MNTLARNILLLSAVAVSIYGCATIPETTPDLEMAQEAFGRAKENPDTLRYAARELEAANATLERAASAASVEDMNSLAYVANSEVQLAEALARRQAAEARVEELSSVKSRVQLEAREADLEASRAKLEKSRADLEASQQQLADLEAKQTERGTVVTLGSVLFATGKSDLLPGAMSSVDRLAEYLKGNEATSAVIEGHTDSTGSDTTNLRLSQARADSVRMELLSRGIGANRIVANGLGSSSPVASNDTAAGRQQNRRVEIIIN